AGVGATRRDAGSRQHVDPDQPLHVLAAAVRAAPDRARLRGDAGGVDRRVVDRRPCRPGALAAVAERGPFRPGAATPAPGRTESLRSRRAGRAGMPRVPESARLERGGDVAVIVFDNPPVNALSWHGRQGRADGMAAAVASDAIAVVLICDGRTFIAGADISEF